MCSHGRGHDWRDVCDVAAVAVVFLAVSLVNTVAVAMVVALGMQCPWS